MTKLGTLTATIAAAIILGGMQHEAEAGWICLPNFGFVGCGEYGGEITQGNATVGLPFLRQLRAGCNTGEWNLAGVEIETGRLPPGLEDDPAQNAIVGVPTRAGSFSFQVLFRGMYCEGGDDYNGDWSGQYTIVVTGN